MCNYMVGNDVQEYRLYRVIKMDEEINLIKSFCSERHLYTYIHKKNNYVACLVSVYCLLFHFVW